MKIAGWILYIVSFGLPAVQSIRALDWFGQPVWGWRCALSALAMPWKSFGDNAFFAFCMLMAGLTNLFVIGYLWGQWRRPQWKGNRYALIGIGLGLMFSWITLVQQEFKPLIGHFVWIFGIGLFVASERDTARGVQEHHS